TVAGQSHDMVHRTESEGGLTITVEDIDQGAAEAGCPLVPAKHLDHVIVHAGAGRHRDAVEAFGSAHPLELAGQHRFAHKGAHPLAGQRGRGHAGLDDGEDHKVQSYGALFAPVNDRAASVSATRSTPFPSQSAARSAAIRLRRPVSAMSIWAALASL